MRWVFQEAGVTRRALLFKGGLFTDSREVRDTVDMLIWSGQDVNCGDVGPHLQASLETPEQAWGTVNAAVMYVADSGSVMAPPSLFPEEIIRRADVVEMAKAQFASRSEAARYAAEQRWKGHVKKQPQGGDRLARARDEAKRLKALPEVPTSGAGSKDMPFKVGSVAERSDQVGADLAEYESTLGTRYVWCQDEEGKFMVPAADVMRWNTEVRAIGAEALAEMETSGLAQSNAEKGAEIQTRVDEIDAEIGKTHEAAGKMLDRVMKEYETGGVVGKDRVVEIASEELGRQLPSWESADTWMRYGAAIKDYEKAKAEYEAFEGNRQSTEGKTLARKWIDARDNLAVMRDLPALAGIRGLFREKTTLEKQQRNTASDGTDYSQAMVAHFGKMGISLGGRFAMNEHDPLTQDSAGLGKKFRSDIEALYPSEVIKQVDRFVQASDRGAVFVNKVAGGGSYNSREVVIETSGDRSTNVHEFMHLVADSSKAVELFEGSELIRRTTGKITDSVKDVPFIDKLKLGRQKFVTKYDMPDGRRVGSGGYQMEVLARAGVGPMFRKDRFKDTYSGRIYGGNNGDLQMGTEILTTGMEHLINEGAAFRAGVEQDRDLMEATLGILLVMGGSK